MKKLLTFFKKNPKSNRRDDDFITHSMEVSRTGLWEWDLSKGELWLSPYLKEMLGYADDELPNEYSTFWLLMHSDDLGAAEAMMKKCMETGRPYEKTSRFKHKNGTLRYILSRAKFIQENGKVIRAIGSHSDVTDLQKAIDTNKIYTSMLEKQTLELERSKNTAESATKMKSDFLANMSHEIRTPMNGVLGMAHLLDKTELNTEQKSYLRTMIQSSEVLLEIVNDILDFSKIEAGKVVLESIPFDMQLLVEDIADMIAYKVREKKLELILSYAPETPRYVIGDPGRIRQIFINLLSNALKFTNEGYISMDVRLMEITDGHAHIRCSVKDTGIGIPKDKLDKIFNKFDQADTSTTRKYGGTGLGLTICREIANMMNGEVGVSSSSGAGSDFWFSVKVRINNENRPAADIDLSPIKGSTILIIDNNIASQNVFIEQIESYGGRTIVTDGIRPLAAKLETLVNHKPEAAIVALSHASPDSPFAISKKLREKYPKIALIYVSSVPFRGERQDSENAGFNAYLKRPVHLDAFRNALGKLIKAYKEGDAVIPFLTEHSHKEERSSAIKISLEKVTGRDVLAVDDNSINRTVLVKMLERYGLNIHTANDGGEAVGKIKRKKYDLIFMDCQMPNMDGYEATQVIREMEKTGRQGRTPIIALTANAAKGDEEKCIKAGMDDYLSKPVKLLEIEEKLAKWLN